MRTLVLILALVFVAATGIPLLRLPHWWIRAFDFPRPQIAIMGILVMLVFLWVWDARRLSEQALLAVLAVSVGYQIVRMLPYTPIYPVQVVKAHGFEASNTLSIVVANVLMDNRKSAELIEIVRARDPDLVLVVEPDSWWEDQLRVLEADYPHTIKHALDNTYGMLLYSRLPLIDPKVEFLVMEDVPSIHASIRLGSGRVVAFHGIHPRPPAPQEAPDSIERDGELLIVARRIGEHDGPSIVAGDFNDVAWSSTTSLMLRTGGLLDPRVGRGLFATFHAQIPVLRWPLDHTFHSEHFQLVELARLPGFGSDHFPVYVHLALTPEARSVQEAPDEAPDDEERAKEKIDKALEAAEEESNGS